MLNIPIWCLCTTFAVVCIAQVFVYINGNATYHKYSMLYQNKKITNKPTFEYFWKTGTFGVIPYADGAFFPLLYKEKIMVTLTYFDNSPPCSV